MADDGSALFAGTTFGDWVQVSVGSWDFAAMKMDVDGNVLWTWQVRRNAEERESERQGIEER